MSPISRRPRNLWWWLYQPYKVLVFLPIAVASTLLFGGLATALSLFLKPRLVGRLCAVPWARLNAYVTPIRVTVTGREHIDPDQSYVIISNHESHYDILVMYGWLGIDFKWVMKQELRKVPGLGIACERLGHIYIDRSDRRAALASIERAKRRIVDGTSVLFFPEGTRSRDGRLGRFKKGAFRMALDLELPILPLTVLGTHDILPAKTTDLRPGSAQLVIHPPIAIDDFGPDSIRQLMEKVRDVVAGPLG